jgi:cell shape-determining protein MreD
MNFGRVLFISILLVWIAGGCQQVVAPALSIGTAQPDFLFVVLCGLAPLTSRRVGTVLGFATGVVQGALVGANFVGYAVSRTLSGFLLGWASDIDIEYNVVATAFTCLVGTILVRLVFMFVAPPTAIAPFLLATIGTAVYNGVLAIPLHFVVVRLVPERDR